MSSSGTSGEDGGAPGPAAADGQRAEANDQEMKDGAEEEEEEEELDAEMLAKSTDEIKA